LVSQFVRTESVRENPMVALLGQKAPPNPQFETPMIITLALVSLFSDCGLDLQPSTGLNQILAESNGLFENMTPERGQLIKTLRTQTDLLARTECIFDRANHWKLSKHLFSPIAQREDRSAL